MIMNLLLQVGGKQVGIVGLGNIGSAVAKKLQGFGCIISYNSRRNKPTVPFPYYANVNELAMNSNVVVCSHSPKKLTT